MGRKYLWELCRGTKFIDLGVVQKGFSELDKIAHLRRAGSMI